MGEQLLAGPGSSRAPQLSITDPKVCRSYLVGTCPHDLFTNTKQDLGLCPKTHSEALKSEYENADDHQKRKWGFEFDYMRDMQKYIDDCNRRIDTAQRRLEKTPDEIRQTNALVSFIIVHTTFYLGFMTYNSTFAAETNRRTVAQHREWSGRSTNSGRARKRQHRRHRVLPHPTTKASEGGSRARAQGSFRHFRSFRPSKTPSVRRVRRLPQQAG